MAAPALLLLACAACRQPPPPAPPPPAVTVARVLKRSIQEWDEFTGRLTAVQEVKVEPRVSGQLVKVAFTEGAEVRAGDLLFQIDPRPFEAAVRQAEAQVAQARARRELARKDVERAQAMIARQAISREEFDTRASGATETDAAVQAAEAALRTAQLNLEWTAVRAPIAGRVSRAEVTLGNLVQAGAPSPTLLTTIVSLDPMYVYFEGDERTYLKYVEEAREGTRPSSRTTRNPVEMGLADEEGYPHKGVVDFVDNRLDPNAGTIRARAVFSNRDRRFTPGLFARLRLVGSGTYDAMLIRDAAVGTDQDRKFVLVLKPDGTVDYRPVQLGRLVDGLRVVRGGLTPEDRIVVNGLQRVRPGMKVTAKEEPMEPPAATDAAAAARK